MRADRTTALVALLAVGVAACQELSITNPNQPNRDRALADPRDVEALISGSWRRIWDFTQGSEWWNVTQSTMADEMTATFANFGSLDLSSEPRRAYDNAPTYSNNDHAEEPYYGFYSALSSASDGLAAIRERNFRIKSLLDSAANGNDTPRAVAFGKFVQGLALGYLSLIFDQGYYADDNTNIVQAIRNNELQLVPHQQLNDSAIAKLQQAITIADTNTFRIPSAWFPGIQLNNKQLVQLAHSYIARLLVWRARTPQERAAAPWARVITHIDNGISRSGSAFDFAPIGVSGTSGFRSRYKFYTQSSSSFQTRADYKLIGPADVSGSYQNWLRTPVAQRQRFNITTPDRRITGTTPTSSGSYFRYLATNLFNDARGTYHNSFYQFFRWQGRWDSGPLVIMSVAEMDLLKAEALFRTGDRAAAATLVNKTRVANGQLPPVTEDGVPEGATCVPRKDDGSCGDLFDAIVYEKRIESAGTESFAWYEMRGWGKLPRGTPLHFAIPGRELETLGLPLYTFGGEGGGSAP